VTAAANTFFPLLILQLRDNGDEVRCRVDMDGATFPCFDVVPPVCFRVLVQGLFGLYHLARLPPRDSPFCLYIMNVREV
jgi:hypothetical protein